MYMEQILRRSEMAAFETSLAKHQKVVLGTSPHLTSSQGARVWDCRRMRREDDDDDDDDDDNDDDDDDKHDGE
jgi:hypothetical protein